MLKISYRVSFSSTHELVEKEEDLAIACVLTDLLLSASFVVFVFGGDSRVATETRKHPKQRQSRRHRQSDEVVFTAVLMGSTGVHIYHEIFKNRLANEESFFHKLKIGNF